MIGDKHPIRVVILDFDGVLVESNAEKDRAFADLFSLYPEHTDRMMKYHLEHMSLPRMLNFEYCVGEIMNRSGDPAAVKAMAGQFSELVFNRVIRCPEVRGARRFLEAFHLKLPLYVASLTPQDELIRIMTFRKLDGFFKGIFGNPPVAKTDAIRKVLATEKVPAAEAVFVGDSVADHAAAKTTGVRFMGRHSGQPETDGDLFPYHDLIDIGDALKPLLGNVR